MTDLLERLRRDDPSALEELGHELLPFVQAAVLAQTFEARDPVALLQAFRDEVALATRASEATTFFSAVLGQLRARAKSIPTIVPDAQQAGALSKLARLEPLPLDQREAVLARFVERLPADLAQKQFGLDAAALAAVLSRGAALLVGPAPGGADWASEPSLLDPNAKPVAQFIELENALTCLAIDVTALERQPLMSAVPVLKPGFEPQVPQEHYPSVAKTQGLVDLPADVSRFAPSVAAKPNDEATETRGSPLVLPPVAQGEATEPRAKPLLAVQSEATQTDGKPLPFAPADATEPRGKPLLAVAPGNEQTHQKLPQVAAENTAIGLSLTARALPLHRRVPASWWWGAASLCAILGLSLYWGVMAFGELSVTRPWQMVPIIAVGRDLPEGTKLTLEMLAVRNVPDRNVTGSVVKPGSIQYAVGQTLEFPLQAGDPLLWAQFDPVRKSKRFDVMKQGRAYAIAVVEQKTLGGQLRPNEEVDLVMTVSPPPSGAKGAAQTLAITLLQKVRVLSVGAVTTINVGREQQRFTTVTFLLSPEEVEVLSLARRSGTLTATLRNTEDIEVFEQGQTAIETLRSGIRLKAIERKRTAAIAIIRNNR